MYCSNKIGCGGLANQLNSQLLSFSKRQKTIEVKLLSLFVETDVDINTATKSNDISEIRIRLI